MSSVLLTTGPSAGEPREASRRWGLRWPRLTWRALVAVGLLSRLFLFVAAGLMSHTEWVEGPQHRNLNTAEGNRRYNERHIAALSAGWRRAIKPWYRYDAIWYAEVSQRGYVYEPGRQCSAAFFPLLPLAMRAGAAVGLDRYAVGLAVTNLAFLAGLVLFGKVALRLTGDEATAWRACALLVAFPTAFFFSSAYPESLAFALTAGAVWAWMNRRPWTAAACLGPATAAKVTAGAVSVALLAQWAVDVARRRPARHAAWPVALAGLLGVGGFYLTLDHLFGDPFAQLKTQTAWNRLPLRPIHVVGTLWGAGMLAARDREFAVVSAALLVWLSRDALAAVFRRAGSRRTPAPVGPEGDGAADGGRPRARGWSAQDAALAAVWVAGLGMVVKARGEIVTQTVVNLLSKPMLIYDEVTMIAFLGLGFRVWRTRGTFWGCLTLVPILQGMATGSALSMTRIALASFPGFIEAAGLIRSRAGFAVVVAGLIAVQLAYFYGFVNWGFVG